MAQQNNHLEAALSAFFDAGEVGEVIPPPVAAPPPQFVPVFLPSVPVLPPVIQVLAKDAPAPVVTRVVVSAKFRDLVLDSTLRVEFKNSHQSAIEASLLWRREKDTVLYGVTVTIGDRQIVGIAKEKGDALDAYDDGISGGKRSVLLEVSNY